MHYYTQRRKGSSPSLPTFNRLILLGLLLLGQSARTDAQVFTELTNSFPGLYRASVSWGDYDNDGRLDLLISGWVPGGAFARVFHNDGNGQFSDIHAALPDVGGGTVAWG